MRALSNLEIKKSPSKKCKICGEVKPITDFYKNHSNKDGYETLCKECRKARDKAKRNAKKKSEVHKTFIICGKTKHSSKFYKTEVNYSSICNSCFKYTGKVPKMIKKLAKKNSVPCTILMHWTQAAFECLEIGCNCQRCLIKMTSETPCIMKKVVLLLTRIHGLPDGFRQPTIIEEI